MVHSTLLHTQYFCYLLSLDAHLLDVRLKESYSWLLYGQPDSRNLHRVLTHSFLHKLKADLKAVGLEDRIDV